MFEGTKAKLRNLGDRIDERLCGVSLDTNRVSSDRELGSLVLSPAVIERTDADMADTAYCEVLRSAIET